MQNLTDFFFFPFKTYSVGFMENITALNVGMVQLPQQDLVFADHSR